jgi:hypothetical protein
MIGLRWIRSSRSFLVLSSCEFPLTAILLDLANQNLKPEENSY